MNILLIYGDDPGTFGRYWKNVLSQKHSVLTCGPKTTSGTKHDIQINSNFIDIYSVINNLNTKNKPDIVIQLDSPFHLYLLNLDKIKAKTVLIWTDVTIKLPFLRHYASCFNYLFTCCETFVSILIKNGLTNAKNIPFAVDPVVHKDHKLKRIYDVGFVGHLSDLYNPKRSYYLNYLKKRVSIIAKSGIYENQMSTFYSKCKIVFNVSATPGINMRTFEALSTGCLLVQNASCTDIKYHFKNGKDLVLYKTKEEAVNLIKYYLKNPDKREKIAKQGQKTVLKNHLYKNRAQMLLSIIDKTQPKRSSNNQIRKALGKSFFMSGIKITKKLEPYAQKPLISKLIPQNLHNQVIWLIKQIETIQFKWTIPYWHFLLALQKQDKLKLAKR